MPLAWRGRFCVSQVTVCLGVRTGGTGIFSALLWGRVPVCLPLERKGCGWNRYSLPCQAHSWALYLLGTIQVAAFPPAASWLSAWLAFSGELYFILETMWLGSWNVHLGLPVEGLLSSKFSVWACVHSFSYHYNLPCFGKPACLVLYSKKLPLSYC